MEFENFLFIQQALIGFQLTKLGTSVHPKDNIAS
jgi:hypothetical protein